MRAPIITNVIGHIEFPECTGIGFSKCLRIAVPQCFGIAVLRSAQCASLIAPYEYAGVVKQLQYTQPFGFAALAHFKQAERVRRAMLFHVIATRDEHAIAIGQEAQTK